MARVIRLAGAWIPLFLIVWALAGFAPGPASAQDEAAPETPAEPAPQVEDEVFSAPVVIDGDQLFVVRGSTALPANERAANVEERIRAAAARHGDGPVGVEVGRNEFGRAITVDGRMITVTTEADAEFEQMDLEVLAGLQAEAIAQAIELYRDERSIDARVDSAVAAFAWTLGFLIVTFVFFKYRSRIAGAAARLAASRFSAVEEATGAVVQGNAVGALARFLVQVTLWVIFLVLLYYYLSFVLLAFAETRPFAQILLTYVSEPLVLVIWGFVAYLPDLITLLIIAVVTRYAIRIPRIA